MIYPYQRAFTTVLHKNQAQTYVKRIYNISMYKPLVQVSGGTLMPVYAVPHLEEYPYVRTRYMWSNIQHRILFPHVVACVK